MASDHCILCEKRIEAEKQKIIQEWQQLREFLKEQEQLLLSWLEMLDRKIAQKREKSLSKLCLEITLLEDLLGGKGAEKEEPNRLRQGCFRSTGNSMEDGASPKAELDLEELEQRVNCFSEKKDTLQEVMLQFKETLRMELEGDTGTSRSA
ncbi:E3 ubiquitin-protein ligase TRIM7-like [Podarcis raffonei]|uniref:E3 ubiquitin-protein ligase TRIM7-like n=1 Tax=Podarcis raffonei TaxID=65483 RepID=UPI0023295693|nr:E3 ubiquitin-protein ligase TRIM7-like [Podarcis raffonei]